MSADPKIDNLSRALNLAEDWGLPVFPCLRETQHNSAGEVIRKEKSPLTDHGLKDATCNREQIERWWTQHPDALIGVPTGNASKLYVVDIDPKGAAWYAQEAARLAAGRVHRTQRGHHLLFKDPGGLPNTGGTLAPGVDTRGEGGYIIWWPAEGLAATGGMEDVAEMPAWLLQRLIELHRKSKATVEEDSPIDQSRDLLRRVGLDIRAGLEAYEIVAKYQFHPHVVKQSDKTRAIMRCVEKCRDPNDKEAQEAAPRGVQLTGIRDILAKPLPRWLIKGVLPEGGLAMMYAEPGAGKTFAAISMAAHVASGQPWHGCKTRGGLVVYVAAESPGSMRLRLDAYRIRRPEFEQLDTLKFHEAAVPLLNQAAVIEFTEKVIAESASAKLIIIDTLSRSIAGANENASEVMTAAVQAGDLIKDRTGAAVLLIHHCGKDATLGGRGHSSLKGGVDTEFELTNRADSRVIKVTKSRDGESGREFGFNLEIVQIGVDEDGDPITSCFAASCVPPPPPKKMPSGQQNAKLLMELERLAVGNAGIWTGPEIRKIAVGLGIHRNTAASAVTNLQKSGFLIPTIGGLKLAN